MKEYVAIKVVKKSEVIRLKQIEHVIAEANILASISSPFIVNIDEKYLVGRV